MAATKRSKLEALVEKLGVTIACKATAPRPGWDPGASHWRCTLRLEGRQIGVPFSMGSAHRGTPDVAMVLRALVDDVRPGETSFSDFCSDFGYDEDSRQAEATWKTLRATAPKVRGFLGRHFSAVERAAYDH